MKMQKKGYKKSFLCPSIPYKQPCTDIFWHNYCPNWHMPQFITAYNAEEVPADDDDKELLTKKEVEAIIYMESYD